MLLPRFLFTTVLIFIIFSLFSQHVLGGKQSYIVYLGAHSHGSDATSADLHGVTNYHYDLLGSFLGSKEEAREAIFYSYKRYINGFAATLEEEDAAKIAKRSGVISPSSIWEKAKFGEDVIIGNLDTGVWPESESFSDQGYGALPSRWKGLCVNDTTAGVPCNRKLIGARYFNKGYVAAGGKISCDEKTARDYAGHGSHTLSTAGGNFVPGANVLGAGNGTAKGGSPRARVAAYKVCWGDGCTDADLLEAFDTAIHDGVDVLSVSVGGDPNDYFSDGIAIGAFHAVKNNIVVVCSAGNSGPSPGTVTNVAPWIITVGASTMDRRFQSEVVLPPAAAAHKYHGPHLLKGASLSGPLPERKLYPLISAGDAKAANASAANATLCKAGTLDPKKVNGKILVCVRGENARVEKGLVAALAGAAAMILCNDESSGNDILADAHFLPAVHIGFHDATLLFTYINSTRNPTGYITHSETVLNTKPAPSVATFSSRGPNTVTPEILKPDITAPGVDILAAYSEAVSITDTDYDKRRSAFNVMSGTSMSCPHVAGAVGLLKAIHPDWSPAAIRSAIMTSARTRDNTVQPMRDESNYEKGTPFGYGAGHIRPNRAMDPGLVYDLTIEDQLHFLCASGYNRTTMRLFSGTANYDCPTAKNFSSIANFNYPSIAVPTHLLISGKGKVTLTRTLKNVATTTGTYAARLRHPRGVSVSVDPELLKFTKMGEEQSFKLTLEAKRLGRLSSSYKFGELLWSDGHHYVRSPILVGGSSSPTTSTMHN